MATPLAINTNGGSLTAQRNLGKSHNAMQTSIQMQSRSTIGWNAIVPCGLRHTTRTAMVV